MIHFKKIAKRFQKSPPPNPELALLKAAEDGDEEKWIALSRIANINTKTLAGLSSLQLAIKKGHYNLAATIITAGINLESADSKGYRALHYAVALHAKKIIVLLLENKVDIDPVNRNNITPFYIAAARNNLDVMELFIKFNFTQDHLDRTLLKGIMVGHQRVVGNVLSMGANKDSFLVNLHKDKILKQNPKLKEFLDFESDLSNELFSAIFSCNIERISRLIYLGANVNMVGNLSCLIPNNILFEVISPLHFAIHLKKFGLAMMLIEFGANIHWLDTFDKTALDYAKEYEWPLLIAEIEKASLEDNREQANSPSMPTRERSHLFSEFREDAEEKEAVKIEIIDNDEPEVGLKLKELSLIEEKEEASLSFDTFMENNRVHPKPLTFSSEPNKELISPIKPAFKSRK